VDGQSPTAWASRGDPEHPQRDGPPDHGDPGPNVLPLARRGAIAVIYVHAVGDQATVTGVDYAPTWVDHPSYTVLPVGSALQRLIAAGQSDGYLATQLRASYRRTVGFIGTGPRVHPIPPRLP
jgi:hypothetical protein